MGPSTRRRRLLPLLWVLAGLSAAPGCAGAHSRPWGYPNGFVRRIEARKGLGRSGQARAPQVNLRVEAVPVPDAEMPGPIPLE